MKVKVLASLLGVSVLFNIAGLVFFICFLKLQGSYKNIQRERNVMAQNLTVVRSQGAAEETLQPQNFYKRTFYSLTDGQGDTYGFQPPSMVDPADNTLVVYLHGMGSNYLEPFIYPERQTIAQSIVSHYAHTAILSCNYRKEASWGSDLAMDDISQNIREVEQQYPIKRIILMGTSMGGCTALTYATQAPADIKAKIKGVVSVEGAGSLKELAELSANTTVKMAIAAAMGGPYEQVPQHYEHKSFLPNAGALPPDVKVAVISAKLDVIVPPQLQTKIVEALEKQHTPVHFISVEGGHGCPAGSIYVEGLDFAGGRG